MMLLIIIVRLRIFIFLLKHTPIIPNFGEEEEDFNILQKFIKANSSEKVFVRIQKGL